MTTAVITLSTPQDYDLRSLAETTRQSLELLKPWTLLTPNPNDALVGEITTQAAKYVSAIQMGVSAAYSGFTVTEEVLFLAHAFPIEDKEDLQRYLVGMMELAKEARENANNAYTAFRNVRGEIFATMEKLKSQEEEEAKKAGTGSNPPMRDDLPQYSNKDLDTLMKFAEHISKFANWWDWVKVETDPSPRPDQPISFQIDTLNDPEVVKRWNHIRQQYTSYVQMIGEIEDSDPQFFSHTSVASQPEQSAEARASTTTERPSSPSASASGPQAAAPPVPPKPQAEPTATPEKANPNPSPNPPTDKQSGTKTNKIKKQRNDTANANGDCTKPSNLGAKFMTKFTKTYPKVAKRVFKGFKEGVKKAHSHWTTKVARRRDTQYPTSPSCSSPKTSFEHPQPMLSPTDGKPAVIFQEPDDISAHAALAREYLASSAPDK